jgi:hypothetical protein
MVKAGTNSALTIVHTGIVTLTLTVLIKNYRGYHGADGYGGDSRKRSEGYGVFSFRKETLRLRQYREGR